MQQKHTIKAAKRTVLGKKTKHLRKEGIMPANIYGKAVESTAIELPLKEFVSLFKTVGETGVVYVQVDGQERPTLIHQVQYDYLTQEPIHADFFQVNLKEKVKTMVSVELLGEPKAIADKVGMLLHTLHEVEVEALPTDLPEHLEIDVTNLAALDDQVTVANITVPSGVTILTSGEEVVAKIAELVSKEAEEEAAAEAAAQAEAKAEGATEGEAAPATETPAAPAAEEK
ncbi:MAG: 50S ribosomal protein L25 [Patescibacteria group bacterium]|nr:50S ribosomal protein L25 [Patescibacteria group bacterium]